MKQMPKTDQFYELFEVLSNETTAYTEEAAEGFESLFIEMSSALDEGDRSLDGLSNLYSDISGYLEKNSDMRDEK